MWYQVIIIHTGYNAKTNVVVWKQYAEQNLTSVNGLLIMMTQILALLSEIQL